MRSPLPLAEPAATSLGGVETAGSFFRELLSDKIVALLLSIAVFFVYALTALPDVGLVDAGEFVLGAKTLGVGHPPGFPLYMLLAHLWTLLPHGSNLARHVNLFSSFCAAATVGIVYLLGLAMLRGREIFSARDENKQRAAAVFAAGVFAFSLAQWRWAGVAEVYSLNVLLVAVVWLLAVRENLLAAAVVAGFATGVHHATVLLALPAAMLMSNARATFKKLAGCFGLFVVSVGLVYSYVPLRAASWPLFNWGAASTFRTFWWHVTGRQYRFEINGPQVDNVKLLGEFFVHVAAQLTVVGLVVAAAGFFLACRRRPWFAAAAASVVLLDAGLVTLTGLGGPNVTGYYLAAYVAMSCCCAFAFVELPWRAPGFAALLLVAALGVHNHHVADQSKDKLGPEFVENALRGVPAGSLLLTGDWNDFYAPWLAMRYAGNFRTDVDVVNTAGLRMSWYLPMVEKEYPLLVAASGPAWRCWKTKLADRENTGAAPDEEFERAYVAVINSIALERIAAGHEVFMTPVVDQPALGLPWRNHGVVYRYGASFEPVDVDLRGVLRRRPRDENERFLWKQYSVMLSAKARDAFNDGMEDVGRAAALEVAVLEGRPAAARSEQFVYNMNDEKLARLRSVLARQGGYVTQEQADEIARGGSR